MDKLKYDYQIASKKLVMFDLDKTLTRSKAMLEDSMVVALEKLLSKFSVAIISGGDYPQFKKQVLDFFANFNPRLLSRLHILPTSGTKYFHFENKKWKLVYAENFTKKEKEKIIKALENVVKLNHLDQLPKYGNRIEDRGSQITLSVLGQNAPVGEKEKWDPTNEKKLDLKSNLDAVLTEFEVRTGGSTSIDITKPGRDKGYGTKKISGYLNLKLEQILFIGDALYDGGNDYAVKALGIDCIETSGPDETLTIIHSIISA